MLYPDFPASQKEATFVSALLMSDSCNRGTSLIRKRTPLGPYRRPVPRVLGGFPGGWRFSYGRGTPVGKVRQFDSRLCLTRVDRLFSS